MVHKEKIIMVVLIISTIIVATLIVTADIGKISDFGLGKSQLGIPIQSEQIQLSNDLIKESPNLETELNGMQIDLDCANNRFYVYKEDVINEPFYISCDGKSDEDIRSYEYSEINRRLTEIQEAHQEKVVTDDRKESVILTSG